MVEEMDREKLAAASGLAAPSRPNLTQLVWAGFLLLTLAACGGGDTPKAVPEPPSLVVVTPGPGVLHVSWTHDGVGADEYIVYREAEDGTAAATELARIPNQDGEHGFYSYMDESADDETRFSYSVAALGPGGTSEATPQTATPALGTPSAQCGGTPTSTDSDGDGISNKAEATGWTVSIVTQTASATGVNGTLERDKTSSTKTSDPTNADTDADGLCDHQELTYRTDPTGETDQDGLSDKDELFTWASDPNNLDSDNDAFDPTVSFNNGQQTINELTRSSGNPDLFDGSEVQTYKTSPTLFDSDGDSYSDYYEIIEAGSSFNPLVANLPQLELSLVGSADLIVNIGYSDSSQKAESKSTGLEQGQSSSKTNYHSNVRKVWHKYDQSVTASAKKKFPLGGSLNVSATASFEEGSATTRTNGWSTTSAKNSKKTYNEAVQTSREQGRTISGGSITLGVEIKNTGDITYALSDLAVTALQRDPDDPTSFKTIATLTLDAKGVSLAPKGTTGTLNVKADLAANVILELMADPSSLLFEIGTFSISNEQKVDFNFLEQVTDAQTGLLLVDFGNGIVISKRVATNVARSGGKITGVPLGDALKTLGLEVQTQTKEVEESNVTVLTGVKDPATSTFVSVDLSNNSFWAVLKTADTTGPLVQDFGDIVLEAGQGVYLLYVTDQDEDGLYLRDESLYGTLDTNKDTDSDGRSDFDEVTMGWRVAITPPTLYPTPVYSDPTLADADQDGLNDAQEASLTTDPNSPDTDSDRLCDGKGTAEGGVCKAGVTADPEPLVPRFVFLRDGSAPEPYTITTPTDAPFKVNFSIPVKESSTVTVRSSVRGPLPGNFSFDDGGRTLTFTPENGWLPGEELVVALSNIISTVGQKLPVYQYGFRAQTNKAGRFPGGSSSWADLGNNAMLFDRVVSGDFNQDGLLDLAATFIWMDTPTGDRQVFVVFQNSTGWEYPVAYSLDGPNPITGASQSLVAGDFNNDGRLDLAVGMPSAQKFAVLLAGTKPGSFLDPRYYSAGGSVSDLATADFNGDGTLDLVVANNLLLGVGDGTFSAGTSLFSGLTPQWVTTGDFNGDGLVDVVTAVTNAVHILLGNGDGTFRQPPQPASLSGNPLGIATGDFNDDGLLDVVATTHNNLVSLLLSSGDGSFAAPLTTTLSEVWLGLLTADFDGDGLLDLAFTTNDESSEETGVILLYGKENQINGFDEGFIGGALAAQIPWALATTLIAPSGSAAKSAPLSFALLDSDVVNFATPPAP